MMDVNNAWEAVKIKVERFNREDIVRPRRQGGTKGMDHFLRSCGQESDDFGLGLGRRGIIFFFGKGFFVFELSYLYRYYR